MSPPQGDPNPGRSADPTPPKLEATEAMAYHCFDVLTQEVLGKSKSWRPFRNKSPTPDYVSELPDPAIECPIFITWDKARPKAGFPGNLLGVNSEKNGQPVYELRGCIGTLSPKPLIASIGDYALTSAMRDRRFQPITAQEIPSLRVAVSLLVQYEPCENCLDWEVGKHGILIRFWSDRAAREYSATYLPEVAKEQGWDQKAAVTALIRKSGYTGIIDQGLFDKTKCTRYQSSKLRMTYDRFMQLKEKKLSQNENNGTSSLPSTEPSSASSSFHQPEATAEDEEELEQLYNHPPQKWNTCNNL